MDHSKILFSSLTTEQVQDLKTLESKFNASRTNNQEVVLIAYENPK
jgi:hypothetical protein